MSNFILPAFGETNISDIRTNETARAVIINDAGQESFLEYSKYFKKNGFIKKENRTNMNNKYASFTDGDMGIFMTYYGNLDELNIITENDCKYFSFTDAMRDKRVTPQITQVHLEDFGMSEVVRLSDGRFIVFDGGWMFEPDIDRLMETLKAGSVYEKPVIAMWVLTHPHIDHYHAFMGFIDKYENDVVIEKMMFNFPQNDDIEHFPELSHNFPDRCKPYVKGKNEMECIPILHSIIERIGIPVYMPHTGQIYKIGDAKCEILSCMDDTIHLSTDGNSTSLVMRMELAGQVILWTGDASFSDSRFADKYGTYLKSDILQVPHHGFQSGTYEAEIEAYGLINPSVCLLEASDAVAFTLFCTFRKGAEYLMRNAGIDELITGEETRTLDLPYTAPEYAKAELDRKFREGRENAGARTWIFMDLNTVNEEDFVFSILNATSPTATIKIELFFEKQWTSIKHIVTEVGGHKYKKICIKDENDVDTDAVYFNWETLKYNGLPENSDFAVRFISDIPIVVTNKNHKEAYKTISV
ncbi:MAG: hypothetical protein IJC09_02045 [Clostridia bacterium]|nr:hypothetical protein [Clostridia bacterium]